MKVFSGIGNFLRGSFTSTPRQSPSESPMGSPLLGMKRIGGTAPSSPSGSPLASLRGIGRSTPNSPAAGSPLPVARRTGPESVDSPLRSSSPSSPLLGGIQGLIGAGGNEMNAHQRTTASAVRYY